MEPHSAVPHKRCIPWQGVLLAASFFIFRSPLVTAQLTIESVPTNAVQGGDVLLLVHNPPDNPKYYYWYRYGSAEENELIVAYEASPPKTTLGSAYRGRETIYPNGTLLIQNASLEDTGPYTLQVIGSGLPKISTGRILVHQLLTTPSIHISNTTVTENEGPVVLTCLTDHTNVSIEWIYNNKTLRYSDRMTLSQNKSVLTINSVRPRDTGDYQCQVSNEVSTQRSNPIRLTVNRE